MLPRPITPSVLPAISTPMNFFFSQIPCFMLSAACGILRASANISPMASSAAAAALPCGVLMTRTPFSVAALTSMLSTPTPARPMIFSLPGLASMAAVILVAERMPRPWYWPMTAASSSGFMPILTSTVKPALLRISTAFLDMSSAMRTRIGSAMALAPRYSLDVRLGKSRDNQARRVSANVACAAATPAPGRMPKPRSESVISRPEMAVMMSNSLK